MADLLKSRANQQHLAVAARQNTLMTSLHKLFIRTKSTYPKIKVALLQPVHLKALQLKAAQAAHQALSLQAKPLKRLQASLAE